MPIRPKPIRQKRRVRAFHVIAVTMTLGCGRGEIVSGVSDSAFVATMAELRQVQQPGMDSAGITRARQGVLQRRGLTAEQLEQAARALAADPDRAASLWAAIDQKASPVAPGALPRPTSPATPSGAPRHAPPDKPVVP